MNLVFELNGKALSLRVDDPDMPLLYLLQGELGLLGPRFGCGLGQCGACTVHLNDRAVRSCVVAVKEVQGTRLTTLEGLAPEKELSPLQQAFIDEQAVQCGYCVNGMIMQASDLLKRTPSPTEDQIQAALAHNLCRCGTHLRIVRAVKRAAESSQRGAL